MNCCECGKFLGDLDGWKNPLIGKCLCEDCLKKLKKE